MPELNEPQAEAVAKVDGPLLVFAGAGSGKTRVITYRVANLLAEHRVPPYRILAVTFTNKAAGEMRSRLEELAGPEVTRDLWVGTFHSTCARLLRRYHAEVDLKREYVIYDTSDQKAVVSRIIKAMKVDDRRYPPKLVLSRIHTQKRDGIRPREVDITPNFDETTVEIFEAYQRALAQASAVDFEDLIVHVMRIAENPESRGGEELRRQFRHVLVDEFQDTNSAQYRLVRAIAARERNLCVVGDDDQSIYRWRGADIRNIRGFRRDFPDATVIKLEQNYRSTANIVSGALGIIARAHEREPKELWTEAEAGEKIVVRSVRDERGEAQYVAQEVQRRIDEGTNPDEIAIFYRVHAQSRVLEEAMRVSSIPYQVIGGMKFFERAEVKDLIAYLRLVDNPASDADLLRIINVPARGIGGKTVTKLLEVAADNDTNAYAALGVAVRGGTLGTGAKKKLSAFLELLDTVRRDAARLLPSELAKKILELTHYESQLREADTAESDARLENLKELVGSIVEYEAEADEAGDTPSISGYLERVTLVSDVDTMTDDPKVALMTVHSAKGLEFDSVFLTGMEEEIFPYRGLDAAEVEELDEERRLAYVAVTRARKRLFITHAPMRMLFGQTRYLEPSRFLADLPEDVVEREGSIWGSQNAGGAGRWPSPAYARPGRWPGLPEPRSSKPALAPGERYVDADAFDDMHEEGVHVRPGDRVVHQRFGRGVVEKVEPGADPKIVAKFPGYGSKKVRADFLERS